MSSTELPPNGQSVKVHALARHGIDPAAMGAVVRAAEMVRRLTRTHDIEVAATVDAASSVEPAPIVLGTRRSVDVTLHLRALLPGHEYVMLHSHPDSESFSWRDAVWLVERPIVRVLVVGRNGTWYILSRDPAGSLVTAREVSAAVQDEYDRLSPPGGLARPRGAVGRAARIREVSHRVWTHLAAGLGFRYDRLT